MTDELFERYKRHSERHSLEGLLEGHRALAASVCRRYLRQSQDVEDATQETLLKLAHHAAGIRGPVAAWVTRAAASTSLDLIRTTLRERRRREDFGRLTGSGPIARQLLHAAIEQHLAAALAALDERPRHLLVQRFFEKKPLRVLAENARLSMPTMSRRVADALEELARILRELGLKSLDPAALADHFGHVIDPAQREQSDALRFAPDWRAANSIAPTAPPARCFVGWTRPVRVGVFVGHLSVITPNAVGGFTDVEYQASTARLMVDPAFQLVGIVEPGTDIMAPIERTLREFELTGGLIDATDEVALATLDVILFGVNLRLIPRMARAFNAVVRSGVGLLNESWTAQCELQETTHDMRDLMLAASPVYGFHTHPRCNVPMPATMLRAHPLLPGLRAGDVIPVFSCGPLYKPMDDAQLVMSKEMVISPQEHRIPGLGPARMPAWIVGQLGRGRVVVASIGHHPFFARKMSVRPEDYVADVLMWLAEPKRN